VSFEQGTFYESNGILPNGESTMNGQFGLGFTVSGRVRGGGGIGQFSIGPDNQRRFYGSIALTLFAFLFLPIPEHWFLAIDGYTSRKVASIARALASPQILYKSVFRPDFVHLPAKLVQYVFSIQLASPRRCDAFLNLLVRQGEFNAKRDESTTDCKDSRSLL
jgi:hypothetical protein